MSFPAVAPIGWGLVAAVSAAIVLPLEPSLLEEGMMLHVAERILGGDHLYRDVYLFTGPFPFLLLAGLFALLGSAVVVARCALLPLVGLAASSSYAIARRSGAGPLSHGVAAIWAGAPILLFPLVTVYFYTTIAFYLVPVAVYATLRGRGSNRWAAGAGVVIAVVALCKQSFGIVLAGGSFVGLLLTVSSSERRNRAIAMLLGGMAVTAITIAAFAILGDLRELVLSLTVLPLSVSGHLESPQLNLWPIGRLSEEVRPNALLYLPFLYHLKGSIFSGISWQIVALTQLLFALPLLALIGTLARRLLGPLPPGVWLHFVGVLTLLTNLYPRGDWGHLVVCLPPAISHLILLAAIPSNRAQPLLGPRVRRHAATAIAFVTYSGVLIVATWLWTRAGPTVFGPRLPLRPVSLALSSPDVPQVISYLRTRIYPNEPIFVARQEPLIYFATGARNPTPFIGLLAGMREEQERVLLSSLSRVRYVVMSDIDQPLYHFYAEELPSVHAYLERHFRIPRDYRLSPGSWIFVLERREDRGETLVDFPDLRASGQGTAWVRSADGSVRVVSEEPMRLPVRKLRRPLAIRLGSGGGGIDFQLEVPKGAVFEADVGLFNLPSSENIHGHQEHGRYALSISRDGGRFETLGTLSLSRFELVDLARWQTFRVDLSEWGGQDVTLRIEVQAEAPLEAGEIEWLGSPRVVAAPPGRAAAGR